MIILEREHQNRLKKLKSLPKYLIQHSTIEKVKMNNYCSQIYTPEKSHKKINNL